MRLLNIHNLELREFNADADRLPYAIASHCWGDEEVTYKDVLKQRNQDKAGYNQVLAFCEVMRKPVSGLHEGLDWLWVDTCCIDKSSSAEVSEAVNSMFRWYKQSRFCLAWLHDVEVLSVQGQSNRFEQFKKSKWFTRGWTLQELLAPRIVLFYDKMWVPCGWEGDVATERMLAAITGIPREYLNGFYHEGPGRLPMEKTKKWMPKWMRDREMSRVEDMAYCQLGLLGVTMPLVYGEREEAMVRLEKAVQEKEERRGRAFKEQQEAIEQPAKSESAGQLIEATADASQPVEEERCNKTAVDWPIEFRRRQRSIYRQSMLSQNSPHAEIPSLNLPPKLDVFKPDFTKPMVFLRSA